MLLIVFTKIDIVFRTMDLAPKAKVAGVFFEGSLSAVLALVNS